MMMPQNAVTIVASVNEQRLIELTQILDQINEDIEHNSIFAFDGLSTNLHFARFLLLPDDNLPNKTQMQLIFLANIDGLVGHFFDELFSNRLAGLDRIFECCTSYPEINQLTDDSRTAFFVKHSVSSSAFYVNTIGRTLKQINAQDKLRNAIQQYLNNKNIAGDAVDIRKSVKNHIIEDTELFQLFNFSYKLPKQWLLMERIRFAVMLILFLIIGLLLAPLLIVWLLILQILEKYDKPTNDNVTVDKVAELRKNEDIFVHNSFSAVGLVKPGFVRLTTLRVVLYIANFAIRHVFNKGNLAGIKMLGLDGVTSIHFARWVLIDDNRRLFFASNYDGSLESYMVDFVDKVAWGLNIVFSNGVDYPETRWLVQNGARDEEKFKNFIAAHQVPTQVWYSSYGHLTAMNIKNNEAIHAGLNGEMDEMEARQWLQLL